MTGQCSSMCLSVSFSISHPPSVFSVSSRMLYCVSGVFENSAERIERDKRIHCVIRRVCRFNLDVVSRSHRFEMLS